MSAWVCPTCGACWSDLFIGPCPHPTMTVTAANTLPPEPPKCAHEWMPSDTSMAGHYCRKCREVRPAVDWNKSWCAAGGRWLPPL